MVRIILHFVNRDAPGLAQDFVSLGFLAPDTPLTAVEGALQEAFRTQRQRRTMTFGGTAAAAAAVATDDQIKRDAAAEEKTTKSEAEKEREGKEEVGSSSSSSSEGKEEDDDEDDEDDEEEGKRLNFQGVLRELSSVMLLSFDYQHATAAGLTTRRCGCPCPWYERPRLTAR